MAADGTDPRRTEQLTALVYDELRRIAAGYLRAERPDHTLQPTALVHEAFLRLSAHSAEWENRSHFLAIAATTMRRVLVDHARRRAAAKRDGGIMITMDDAVGAPEAGADALDLLAVDEALARFAALDERAARVVELRFFGGLSVEETAEALRISSASVKRDWTFARAWLGKELGASRASS